MTRDSTKKYPDMQNRYYFNKKIVSQCCQYVRSHLFDLAGSL